MPKLANGMLINFCNKIIIFCVFVRCSFSQRVVLPTISSCPCCVFFGVVNFLTREVTTEVLHSCTSMNWVIRSLAWMWNRGKRSDWSNVTCITTCMHKVARPFFLPLRKIMHYTATANHTFHTIPPCVGVSRYVLDECLPTPTLRYGIGRISDEIRHFSHYNTVHCTSDRSHR